MSAVSVTPDALGAVLRGYRLPAGGPVVPLNDGDDDHHSDLVVRVAGDVVVRFVADRQWSWYGHQWYTDELLRQQLRFVDHVRTRGVAFPARLRPSDGDWSGGDWMEVRSDGVRYRAVAFAWFPGARAPRRRGRRIAHGAGALLGRLHRAAADFRPGADLGTESLVGWATQVADELADLAEAMPAPLRAPTHRATRTGGPPPGAPAARKRMPSNSSAAGWSGDPVGGADRLHHLARQLRQRLVTRAADDRRDVREQAVDDRVDVGR